MSVQDLARRTLIPEIMTRGVELLPTDAEEVRAVKAANLRLYESFAQAARQYPEVFELIVSIAGVLAPLGQEESLEVEEGKRRLALQILACIDIGERADDYRKEQT